MTRKSVNLKNGGSEDGYKQTDFYRRFSKFINRGLKDHRYSAEFSLNALKRYSDDVDK
jgi:predicted GNAT superfamily acetyltransferase